MRFENFNKYQVMGGLERNSTHFQNNNDRKKLIKETKDNNIFKLNGWKATILIVLVNFFDKLE